jgi:hypothetical protein
VPGGGREMLKSLKLKTEKVLRSISACCFQPFFLPFSLSAFSLQLFSFEPF